MTGLEKDVRARLRGTLDKSFPEDARGAEGKARARAEVLFADAMVEVREVVKAFGGCELCYGKGYSTSAERGIIPCSCNRGLQINRLLKR